MLLVVVFLVFVVAVVDDCVLLCVPMCAGWSLALCCLCLLVAFVVFVCVVFVCVCV